MTTIWQTSPIQDDDLPFVREMGFEAAAVSLEVRAMGMERALSLPSLSKYLEGWGRPGDTGFVAVDASGRRLGAAWYRLFPAGNAGYGFVAESVPELSIAVVPEARGLGVGGLLLEALKAAAREEGFDRLSLSVERRNPALRLYERHGFRDAGVSSPADSSVTMVAELG